MLFGFDQLDELAFLGSTESVEQHMSDHVFSNIGTIVELELLRKSNLGLPPIYSFKETSRLQLFRKIAEGSDGAMIENRAGVARFIRSYWGADENEPDEYYDFCQTIQKAARNAGFPSKNAAELVAATRELVGNIYDHSNATSSGLVGFSLFKRMLEVVVADEGVGVLRSLKMSDEFSHLRDSGEALNVALIDGVSRYGAKSGHGGGFRSLFRGLVNLSSKIRFRSGDHSLDIHGTSPTSRSGRIGKKAELQGFVVSISCAF
jgi:hypothetical protein